LITPAPAAAAAAAAAGGCSVLLSGERAAAAAAAGGFSVIMSGERTGWEWGLGCGEEAVQRVRVGRGLGEVGS